jgi:hypothetical protein
VSIAAVVLLQAAPVLAWVPATESTAPNPLVERTLTVGSRQVRVSFFDNWVVVVSTRLDDQQVLFRKMTLSEDEFVGYLVALQRDAVELGRGDRRDSTESTAGVGIITLYIGPDAPKEIRYSQIAVLNLVTARLVATLDDLERRVLWGEPAAADLEGWNPKRGDRVELRNGVRAEVIEVRQDGALVLEHDDTWINEVVAAGSWQAVVHRVLEDEQ